MEVNLTTAPSLSPSLMDSRGPPLHAEDRRLEGTSPPVCAEQGAKLISTGTSLELSGQNYIFLNG